ncbi:class I SAM-dependent methyltransferase [uncultured Parvibaculum sp.]|uniref:class I SAM-dependent methyltransferase n=1 Tax=uncultured Parvibaculum sp. TaxID=291828 RepID=UPI0030EC0F83|tara:strand:- start:3273 stop:4052 length:780 start_codon:yes stop_codon:yes gene_type:complete
MEILDAYVTTPPDPQAVIDIFNGEWSSMMPEESGLVSTPGTAALFADARISWLADRIGGFDGKNILELGPLEAGHTFMMHNGNARAITAIESNSRSFLKCLCIKEIFNLHRAQFLYADALEYAAGADESFDLCVASGILYHMTHPIDLLQNLTRLSSTLFLWTHYYDQAVIGDSVASRQFESATEIEVGEKKYTAAKRNYLEALNWAGFCGGSHTWAYWLTRPSLLQAIEQCGFNVTEIGFDNPNHPNGPALALIAHRR